MIKQLGNDKVMYVNQSFKGYFNREGYVKVKLVYIDTSTIQKGYVGLFLEDLVNGGVYQAPVFIEQKEPDRILPLERMVELLIEEKFGSVEGDCYELELTDLIGIQFQVLILQRANYYNIAKVYSIDEELGEYEPPNNPRRRNVFRDRNSTEGTSVSNNLPFDFGNEDE